MFQPTAISYDNKGKAFVAAMESFEYPFYGVQFHPEKQQFVYYPTVKIDHSVDTLCNNEWDSIDAIAFNRYFADFFIGECRLNDRHFDSYEESEVSSLTQAVGELVFLKSYTGLIYAF